MSIFADLADNEHSGCRLFLGADSRKRGPSGGVLSLFNRFCLRQFCPPLGGFFRLAPKDLRIRNYIALKQSQQKGKSYIMPTRPRIYLKIPIFCSSCEN